MEDKLRSTLIEHGIGLTDDQTDELVNELLILFDVSIRYSDCCNAPIDTDEQSLEICFNCGDRI